MTNDEIKERLNKVNDFYGHVSRWGMFKASPLSKMDELDCMLFWYVDMKIKDGPGNIILDTFRNRVRSKLEIKDVDYESLDLSAKFLTKYGLYIGSRATSKLKWMIPDTQAKCSESVLYNLSEEPKFKGRFVNAYGFGEDLVAETLLFKSLACQGVGDSLYAVATKVSSIFESDSLRELAEAFVSEDAIRVYVKRVCEDAHKTGLPSSTQANGIAGLKIICDSLIKDSSKVNNALILLDLSFDADAFNYALFDKISQIEIGLPELCT